MPVFEIGLEDGRKLRIDAADQNAALAGVQHFLGNKEQPQQSGNVLDAVRQGAAGLVSGGGETASRYFGAENVGNAMKGAGEKLAPQNQADTTLYDDKGFHAGNIPNAIAEGAPGMAAAIAAARMTPGPIWAKLAAGGLVGLGSMAGNYAKEATEKRTGDANAPSSAEDLTAGLTRGAPEAAIQALPLGRFVGGPTARLGAKGVVGSLGRTAVDAAAVGAGSYGTNLYDQGYMTGTVDPTSPQAIDAAAKGAVTGGAFGAGRFAQDAKAAYKYRGLANEAPEHISEAANRVKAASENIDSKLSSPKGGFDALRSAQADVGTEFKGATKAIKASGALSPQSEQALARAQKGLPLGDADIAALNADTNNHPAIADLQRLGGVARSLEGFANTGHVNEARGTLTGGISGSLGHHVRGLSNPHGAIVGAGLMGLGGAHLGDAFAHSPAALAALGSGYALARAVDFGTGNRSPAYAAVKRFATDGFVPPAAAPQPPQVNNPVTNGSPGLQALVAQATRLNPTGPRVAPPFVSPWAPAPNQPPPPQPQPQAAPAPAPNFSALKPAVQAALKARMGALNMGTAPEVAPQAAPTPDLSGMRGGVLDALKARMNVIKMQNAQPPIVADSVPNVAPSAPIVAQSPAPEIAALVPQVTKLTKSNGKVKQTVVQKPSAAPAETPAPAPRPVAEPKDTAPQGPVHDDLDLTIPDFLRRTEGLAKLNAGPTYTPVPAREMKSPEVLAMSHEDYAKHKYDGDASVNEFAKGAYKAKTVESRKWKEGVSKELAKMFPHVGNKDWFFGQLESTNVRAPIRQLREHLKALDPTQAKEVNSILSETQLERVWRKVGANR